MLQIRDLTVRFGQVTAVDAVTMTVPTGVVQALLGPSGCGKSTLLRAVAGLVEPSAGGISYDGQSLAGVPVHRRGFALMFQDGQLFAHQSVARNIGYPLRLRHLARPAIGARVAELLELVGLSDAADRMPGTLSGGERQRVALARALAVRPRLLLLDEPLSALDRDLRESLAGQLREILKAEETTAIMVTHDQEEAFAVADQIGVMRAGALIQVGTASEVWQHPGDAWTAKFLGYATVLEGSPARILTGSEAPIAVRRSALRVDSAGPLEGRVVSARSGPEQTRVELDVAGVGRLDAVAEPGVVVPLGVVVRVSLDTSRAARLPTDSRQVRGRP